VPPTSWKDVRGNCRTGIEKRWGHRGPLIRCRFAWPRRSPTQTASHCVIAASPAAANDGRLLVTDVLPRDWFVAIERVSEAVSESPVCHTTRTPSFLSVSTIRSETVNDIVLSLRRHSSGATRRGATTRPKEGRPRPSEKSGAIRANGRCPMCERARLKSASQQNPGGRPTSTKTHGQLRPRIAANDSTVTENRCFTRRSHNHCAHASRGESPMDDRTMT